MMTNERFQRLLNECKNELNALGIRYYNVKYLEVNTRAKTRWGQCRRNNRTGEFKINLSNELLKTGDKEIKDTIIHELIHTVEGCMNHGELWKHHAMRVNRTYGYNVSRTTKAEDKGIEIKQRETTVYKYNVTCQGCGKVYSYQRKSKLFDNLSACSCNKCKSHNLTLKQNY